MFERMCLMYSAYNLQYVPTISGKIDLVKWIWVEAGKEKVKGYPAQSIKFPSGMVGKNLTSRLGIKVSNYFLASVGSSAI